MSLKNVYYTAYEEDEELSESQSESSGDEIEKDVGNFFKSKNIKTTLNKEDLANEFENEMNQQLDNLINQQKHKYFQSGQQTNKTNTSMETMEQNKDKVNIIGETQDYQKVVDDTEMNYEIEDTDSEEEMATGARCKKKKPQFTNDELFYDPNMDDQDQNWINKQRKTAKKIVSPKKPILSFASTEATSHNEPEVVYSSPNSDAVLNCPGCMALLSMDCQRHETLKTQYRAMFVFNCKINEEELLKYPKNEKIKKKHKKSKKNKIVENIVNDESELNAAEAQFDVYKSVACNNCNSNVGVYDEKDEIYYFFNVLAGHS